MSPWELRMVHTGVKLREAGYPAYFFDAHVPYPLRKVWVKEALRFDFAKKPGMYVFSTILNCCADSGLPMKGQRVRAWLGEADLAPHVVDSRLAKNRFACLTADSLNNAHIVSQIEHLFTDPAPWEMDTPAYFDGMRAKARDILANHSPF